MKYFLIVVLFLSACAISVEGTQCYSCWYGIEIPKSYKDCWNVPSREYFHVNCSSASDVCATWTVVVDDEDKLWKGCVSRDQHIVNGCKEEEGKLPIPLVGVDYSGTVKKCTCDSDFCNSAHKNVLLTQVSLQIALVPFIMKALL